MKKKLRTFGRKSLSMLLALIMLCSVMGITALATETETEPVVDPTNQIVEDGGSLYYMADGSDGTASNHDVALSKTIYATGVENEFDIELMVETDMDLEKSKSVAKDTAVVLTIDLSGTMQRSGLTMDGKYYLTVAKEKAKNFLDQYATANPDGVATTGKRWVAIVRFDTDAKIVQDWIDVSNSTNLTAAKNKINNLSIHGGANSYDNYVCTNFDAGVILSRNLLKQNKVAYIDKSLRWDIILSDGAPTVTVNSDSNTVGEIKSSFWGDQKDANGVKYDTKHEGGGWTHFAEVMSAEKYIKSLAEVANVFIIGVGGKMDFELFYDGSYGTSNGTRTSDVKNKISAFSKNVALLKDKTDAQLKAMTTGDWMNMLAGAAGGTYVSAASSSELANKFTAIFNAIKESVNTSYKEADAWSAIDPIGGTDTPCVDFLGFWDGGAYQKGCKSLSTEADPANDNTASYSSNNISWNLLTSTPVSNSDNVRTYLLKYRVRLATEESGFESGTPYVTNGETTLSYQEVTFDATTGDPTVSDTREVDFPIPEVKGYLGTFSFKKTDKNGNALAGAEFSLTHKDCACSSEKKFSLEATSADGNQEGVEKGTVTFSNIPSGHTYTLKEENPPKGFDKTEALYEVTAAYGTVTVYDPLTKTNVALDNFAIVNQRTPNPPLVTIDVAKEIESNATIADDAMPTFTFELVDNNTEGTLIGNQSVEIKGAGSAELAEIQYAEADAGKTFTYTVREVIPADPAEIPENWTYDGTVYTVTVQVTKDNDDIYDAEVTYTKADGATANGIIFTNSYYEPQTRYGTIELTKTTIGDVATPDTASFQLQKKSGDSWNNVGEAVTYADIKNGYTFSELNAGEYRVVEDQTSAMVANYDLTVNDSETVILTSSIDPQNGDTIISSDDNAITITNTYEIQKGNLTITKEVLGEQVMPDTAQFQLKNAAGEVVRAITWIVVKAQGGSYTFEGIPVGEYTLVESGVVLDNYTLNPENHEQTVTIENGKTTVAEKITNTYEEIKGASLIIKKSFSGADNIAKELLDAITFTVTGPENYNATFSYAEFADGQKTIANLKSGIYTVTETNAAVADYELTVKVAEGEEQAVESDTINVTLPVAGQKTVSFTNEYVKGKGSLKITKTIKGLPAGVSMPDETLFEVKDAAGETVKSVTWAVVKEQGGTYTFTDIPVGQYTVVESEAGIERYAVETDVVYNNDETAESVMVIMNGTVNADITNTYEQTVFYYDVVHEFYYSENGADYGPARGRNAIDPEARVYVSKTDVIDEESIFNGENLTDVYTGDGKTYARLAEYEMNEIYHEGSLENNSLVYVVKYYLTNWTEGSLKIVKNIEGLDETAERKLKSQLQFEVTGFDKAGEEIYNETFSFAEDFKEGKLIIEPLDPGTYTVKEIGAEIEGGYDLTVKSDKAVEVKAGPNPATFEITNQYTSRVYNIWFDGGKHGDVLNTKGDEIDGLWRSHWHNYKTGKSQLSNDDFDWASKEVKPGDTVYRYGSSTLYPDLVENPEVPEGTEMVMYTITWAQWNEHAKKMGISTPDLVVDNGWKAKTDKGDPMYYVVGAEEDVLFTSTADAIAYMNEFVEPDANGFYNVLYRPEYTRDTTPPGDDGDDDDDDDDDIPPIIRIPEEDPPLVDIPEEEPPLVEVPEDVVDLFDEEVPLTGDNMMLYVVAAVASATGLVYLTVSGKKREEEMAE